MFRCDRAALLLGSILLMALGQSWPQLALAEPPFGQPSTAARDDGNAADFCAEKEDGVYLDGGRSPLVMQEGDNFDVRLYACRLPHGQTTQMQVSGPAISDELLAEAYDVVAEKALQSQPSLTVSRLTSNNFQYLLPSGSSRIDFSFKLARGRTFTGSDAAPWVPGKQEQIDFILAAGSSNPAPVRTASIFKLVTEGQRTVFSGERAARWSILRSTPAIRAGESVTFEVDESGTALENPTTIRVLLHASSTVSDAAFEKSLSDALTASVPPGKYDVSDGKLTFDRTTIFPVKFTLTAGPVSQKGDFILELKDNKIGEIDVARAGVHLGEMVPPPPKPAMGVNMSGGEFGTGTTFNKDYIYPENARLNWAKEQGFGMLRIPFKFENIQPNITADIRPQDLSEFDRMASQCARNGLICIFDMHDYGSYYADDGNGVKVLGTRGVSNRRLADLWAKIARRYKDNEFVWFGLMNEPHEQTALAWVKTANTVALAIRDAGAMNKIVFQGSYWDGAHSWDSTDNSVQILKAYDPLNNFAVEAHQYLDVDSSGTSPTCVPGSGARRLEPFTHWLKKYKLQGIIGEAGWSSNAGCLAEGEEMLRSWKSAIATGSSGGYIGFTYWAAGPWWDAHYPFLVEPRPFPAGTPPPMLEQIKTYIPH